MRVAVLVHYFPVRSQTWIVDHVGALRGRGHEVVVIPLMSRPSQPWEPPAAVRDVVHATRPRPKPRGGRSSDVAMVLRNAAAPRRVRFAAQRDEAPRGFGHRLLFAERVQRSGPFDVVHAQFAWTAPAAVALQRTGLVTAPIVCSIHGQDANVTARQRPGWLAALARDIRLVTVGSTHMRGVVADLGVPTENVRMWPQGVDTGREPPPPRRADGAFRVLSVGRLVAFKGFDDSIRVVAAARDRISGLHLTIIGDGPERRSLEQLARELGVSDIVTFAGARNHDEVLAEHATTDAYLQMGKTATDGSTEGQGVAACEAAASELPTVASRSGGLTDVVVDGQTGLLVDVGDIAGGADALVRVAADGSLRRTLGRNARAHMETSYSITVTMDRIEAIYREAVG